MKTLILTTALAAAVALTPMSVRPAAASDADKVIGLILGAAVLGALANRDDTDNETKIRNRETMNRQIDRTTRRKLDSRYCEQNQKTRRECARLGWEEDVHDHGWNGNHSHRNDHTHGKGYGDGHTHGKGKGRDDRRAKVLPGECLFVADGRKSDRILFSSRCLERKGIGARRLPDRCEVRVKSRRGPIDAYGARCLADAGWSLPRVAVRR